MKRWVLLASGVLVATLAVWWFTHRNVRPTELVLYGNVDLRQVDLAFNDSERIAAVLVQEGDRVRRGQVLAQLDTGRLQPLLEEAEAAVAAQRSVVERLHNGSRPEEIAEARANVALEEADVRTARLKYERLKSLAERSAGRAVGRQDLDDAQAAADVAAARLDVNHKALRLEVIGPRREDIAQAEAQLAGDEAQAAFARQQLADAQLRAPLDAIVRSRIAEPGDMASPQKTAFTLAITDPKWVRAYVSEVDLARLRPGMQAAVSVDTFPGRRFAGWIGFISPQAEFTPKSVETPELRSSLVYEVRVFISDRDDELRLGMPATVHLLLGGPALPASDTPLKVPAGPLPALPAPGARP
ncbi:MAG: efflux RND transporter periplasmic adaptor subunit [Steroidobacteraceae bacterium]